VTRAEDIADRQADALEKIADALTFIIDRIKNEDEEQRNGKTASS